MTDISPRPDSRGASGDGRALHLDLGARLDKPAATVLAKKLREFLYEDPSPASGPITLDARAVARVTTNAVQVLLAAEKAAAEAGRPFVVRAPSDALLSALSDLGVPIDELAWSLQP